jgi:hypothetical protein
MAATFSQATSDLKPYVTRLRRCVEDAIRAFMADQASHLYRMRLGTQANLLRDYIVEKIQTEFPDGEDGISHHSKGGLFLLNIKNRYYLRFKKLDRRHHTRNIVTQLSLDYLLQRPLELFPELPVATHLNVGYQRGITLSQSTVWITCPDGDVLDWKWGLSETADLIQLPVAAPQVTPESKPNRTLVRPKPTFGAVEQGDEPRR